ncbi:MULTISPECIES: hypothetical protein [unclassified Sphingomonas]|uniref:hypothetical protein n=1 Tax=unclassified Sphingomonas TaxID=196159 RepID=UPI0021506E63|nr:MULTISPECIES: hypothetical protein [unclassified Sphingomonas]MCR5870666.1 hypothetical protein [Sphingomonas sp. J344]UUY00996.1 hypothetical protein LRS08_08055 [Sphingomonas sp. J315]
MFTFKGAVAIIAAAEAVVGRLSYAARTALLDEHYPGTAVATLADAARVKL